MFTSSRNLHWSNASSQSDILSFLSIVMGHNHSGDEASSVLQQHWASGPLTGRLLSVVRSRPLSSRPSPWPGNWLLSPQRLTPGPSIGRLHMSVRTGCQQCADGEENVENKDDSFLASYAPNNDKGILPRDWNTVKMYFKTTVALRKWEFWLLGDY